MKKVFFIGFNVAVLAVVIVYPLWFYPQSFLSPYVSAFAMLLLAAFVASCFLNNRLGRVLKGAVLFFCITYILLELSTYLLVSFNVIRPDMQFFFGGCKGTSGKVFVYDSICGYKYVPGHPRILSIENGKTEIDVIAKFNNHGWSSGRDYSFKKRNRKIKRYIVLGDSYSSAPVVPTVWPDIVQNSLEAEGNDSIELYNFSLDGSGIVNWYRTFMYEVVPKYEFDGVIIAASFEPHGIPDLDRKFIMASSGINRHYMYALDILKQSPPASFPVEKAAPVGTIYPGDELDRIKNKYTRKGSGFTYRYQKPDFWFLATFLGITNGVQKILYFVDHLHMYNKPYEEYEKLADQPYKMEYFDSRYKCGFMLKEILSFCKSNHKDIILVTIPDAEHALDYINGREFIYHKEHRFLADYYHLKYFDGFAMFKGRTEDSVKNCFYEYDRHWNRVGVELFSEKFIEMPYVFK